MRGGVFLDNDRANCYIKFMEEIFSRTEMLLGAEALKKLVARVAVFGIGGVGGYTAEALTRSGVPASWAYVPSVAGLSIAGEAVKHLIK